VGVKLGHSPYTKNTDLGCEIGSSYGGDWKGCRFVVYCVGLSGRNWWEFGAMCCLHLQVRDGDLQGWSGFMQTAQHSVHCNVVD